MIKQFVTTGIMYKKRRSKNNSTFVKIIDDPRVTKVGKFIRNTSIDELPQLINVLKGDMSIVGNRPLPVYEAELITAGDLSKGFSASGITGLWQVELRGKGGKCLKTKECVLTTNMPTNLQEIIIHFGMILNSYLELFQHYSKGSV
jgi:lipopolysaccharide/colanic/teichoic acid biosynthesis glycosyltransferase